MTYNEFITTKFEKGTVCWFQGSEWEIVSVDFEREILEIEKNTAPTIWAIYSEVDLAVEKTRSRYRVLFCPAIERSEPFSIEVDSLANAELVLNAIADYTLDLHRQSLMIDYPNFGVVEKLVDGEWEELEV